ncbi:NAC domain-containing protein 104-like [Prosopis cineraria]|uniref:NAC domain-containing protein 104-like n=1 Tax=Prosopis cineraria TaxID=364024 RepID=UPI00240EBCA5|nr:NAC domain-containing protein 104-like [Prosopis cineraria]
MADNYTVNLPPGFRFYPTDEELIVHFLQRKASLLPCHPDVIPDLELYPYDPWDLEGKALGEGNQWYFYSRRTQNRVTVNGYWKEMGMEDAVIAASSNKRVGMKKYFVFYEGQSPNSGIKTNWVMQEYRLSDSSSSSSSSSSKSSSSSRRKSQPKPGYRKWVICRVYERNDGDGDGDGDGGNGIELSSLDEVFLSMDDLEEISLPIS